MNELGWDLQCLRAVMVDKKSIIKRSLTKKKGIIRARINASLPEKKNMSNSPKHEIGKEHPQSHLIQAGCGLTFFAIWLLDLILIQLPNHLLNNNLLILQILVFVVLLILAIKFGMTSHNLLFGGVNKPSRFISDDVFAVVRHPMYFSILVLYLGFIFLSLSLISIIPWVITLILYNKIAIFEEKELENILGKEYSDYQKKVPRWIPKLSSLIKLFFKGDLKIP